MHRILKRVRYVQAIHLNRCIVCASAFSPAIYANDWDVKQILVLHSYEPSYQWAADFQKGIDNAFK